MPDSVHTLDFSPIECQNQTDLVYTNCSGIHKHAQ